MTATRRVHGTLALLAALLVLVHVATSSHAIATASYLVVLLGASVVAWWGAERVPHANRAVPRLIAGGVSLTALGDLLWAVLDAWGADTAVSIADPPWFISYVLLCAAVWIALERDRSPDGGRLDADFAIDVVTILVVSLLAFWSVSIDGVDRGGETTTWARLVWAAYPVADAVLLALVLRALMSPTARSTVGASFGVGVCLWLAADIAFLREPSVHAVQSWLEPAWMIAPVLLAGAAWRTRVEVAGEGRPPVGHGWGLQLVIAVCPLLVPPALELVSDLRGVPDQPFQLFLGTIALTGLAFVRTGRLLRAKERAHRDLGLARDAALQASHAKSMFLANVSHEIRTPLTTVLASAELLEDTSLDTMQLTLVRKMQRTGSLLKDLVEGILDFSRIEAGQLTITARSFDLRAMLDDVLEVYEPRAEHAGIHFRCRVERGLPPVLLGDPGRLFQVLANLLDNALKFTHEGSVSLIVEPGDPSDAASSSMVRFIVTDTGIGIAQAELESVFDSFTQVDGSTTRRYGGSGLGLAICRELTALMGGTIETQSTLGVGTTFTVTLPHRYDGGSTPVEASTSARARSPRSLSA